MVRRGLELGGVADGPGLQKAEQVVGGGAVAVDGWHRRAQHLLVVLQPAPAQLGDADRLEGQRGRRAELELGVNLGGELAGASLSGPTRGRRRRPCSW